MEEQILASSWIQAGFAGFCVVQFVVIVWLIRQLLAVIKTSNEVNGKLTGVIETLSVTCEETKKLLSEIRDRLLSRPCMIEHKG